MMQDLDKHWTHTCLLESPRSELEHRASSQRYRATSAVPCVEAVGRIIETPHMALVVSMLLCDDEATLQRKRFARLKDVCNAR